MTRKIFDLSVDMLLGKSAKKGPGSQIETTSIGSMILPRTSKDKKDTDTALREMGEPHKRGNPPIRGCVECSLEMTSGHHHSQSKQRDFLGCHRFQSL